ncbi:MAG: CAP domain-containing protein [Clostridiales bacterium]|jgi:uncharacterized YkwD family protein/spore coat assembly protein SafA|nr:CAP domain-containing protein [Clostridiales bacterium]
MKKIQLLMAAAAMTFTVSTPALAAQINTPSNGLGAPSNGSNTQPGMGGYNSQTAPSVNTPYSGYNTQPSTPGNGYNNAPNNNFNAQQAAPGNNNNYNTQPAAPGSNYNTQQAAPYNSYNNNQQTVPGSNYNTQQTAPGSNYNTQQTAPGSNYNTQQTAPGSNYNTQQTAPYNNYNTQPAAPNNGSNTRQAAPNNGSNTRQAAPNNGYNTRQAAPGGNYNTRQAAPNNNYNAQPGGYNAPPTTPIIGNIQGVDSDAENADGGQGVSEPTPGGRTRPLLKTNPVQGKIDAYNVHSGDTLWIISKKYGIKLDAVIDANPDLEDPDLIYPGDEIAVPLDPKVNDNTDIGAAKSDLGDGTVQIRSNIIQGRYAGLNTQGIDNAKAQEILQLVNKERSKTGVAPLTLASDVSNVADIKAEEMSGRNYFDHTSPIYGSPFEMLRSFGILYKTSGENIGKGQKTASAVMAAWMSSPAHRANILNPKFAELGVGYANSGSATYWVQIFVSR